MTPIPVPRLRRSRGAAALVAGLTLAVVSVPFAGAPSTARPTPRAETTADLAGLRVLLTNDDSAQGRDASFGTDGKGLYELRKALCAAGADVLTVAPWLQQSGAGARITTPGFAPVPITVQRMTAPTSYAGDCASAPSAGAVFGVCQGAAPCASTSPSASPADAVSVALSRFAANYWDGGPDVVLSGVNFGQNVGTTINHSGTVGAAVTANEHDVPAIALSAEVPRDLSQIPRTPFAATAAFAVRLLDRLDSNGGLRAGLVLNVNHPFVPADGTVKRPVFTVAGESSDIGLTYNGSVSADGGTYQLVPGAPEAETRSRADTTALAEDHISVSQLDGDWTLPVPSVAVASAILALR